MKEAPSCYEHFLSPHMENDQMPLREMLLTAVRHTTTIDPLRQLLTVCIAIHAEACGGCSFSWGPARSPIISTNAAWPVRFRPASWIDSDQHLPQYLSIACLAHPPSVP